MVISCSRSIILHVLARHANNLTNTSHASKSDATPQSLLPLAMALDVAMTDSASPAGGSGSQSPKKPPAAPNVLEVVFGSLLIKPWYPSFYPEELVGGRSVERLFVCQWCFKYSVQLNPFLGHLVRFSSSLFPSDLESAGR